MSRTLTFRHQFSPPHSLTHPRRYGGDHLDYTIELDVNVVISGDILVRVYHQREILTPKMMFRYLSLSLSNCHSLHSPPPLPSNYTLDSHFILLLLRVIVSN